MVFVASLSFQAASATHGEPWPAEYARQAAHRLLTAPNGSNAQPSSSAKAAAQALMRSAGKRMVTRSRLALGGDQYPRFHCHNCRFAKPPFPAEPRSGISEVTTRLWADCRNPEVIVTIPARWGSCLPAKAKCLPDTTLLVACLFPDRTHANSLL